MLGSDAMQLASVRRELQEEREAHEATARELAALRAATQGKTPADPATHVAPESTKKPKYSFPTVAEALGSVDWPATGLSVVKMGPLLVEFGRSLAAGDGLPSSIGELQRWNAPLLTMALEVRKKGVSGTGIPGTFSHPSIVVNMVHAAMLQGDKPLSEEQARRLGELGSEFVQEDARRLAGYDESTFQITKTTEEAALKDRLYRAIDALLTEEQRELLHPQAVRDRNGLDIFSSAVVWNGICGPLRFETRTDLARALVKVANQRSPIPAELQPVLQDAAAEWARSFSDEYLAQEPDALFREGMALGGTTGMPTDRARVAGKHAVAFYRMLHDRLPADSEAAVALRKAALVPVPIRIVPKSE